MISIRVLIVDDDSIVCRGLKALIPWDELDAEFVGEAENGEQAYSIAVEKHPDLIITDIKMPVMDGLELCKKVYETMADTSIILLSAHEDFEYARTAIQYGVRNYILKPIDREKINQLIDDIRNISSEFKKRRNFYAAVYDKEMENSLRDALKDSDSEFFTSFFESYLQGLNMNVSQAKDLCIRLVNVLFDYLVDVGFNIESIDVSKESIIDDVLSKKTRKEVEFCTQQLYLDILQFTEQKKDSRSDSMINFVINCINEDYSNCDFSVSSVADKLNISPAYLSAIFRQVTGINMSTYITDIRVKKACLLLENPALKMSDICSCIGYQDAHYFAKVFKKVKGLTPSEYRNLKLG